MRFLCGITFVGHALLALLRTLVALFLQVQLCCKHQFILQAKGRWIVEGGRGTSVNSSGSVLYQKQCLQYIQLAGTSVTSMLLRRRQQQLSTFANLQCIITNSVIFQLV
jgi:hypothetical protein